MKMDAVPGIPTTMWFTPKYTTAQMKEITGNKNFVYEIACDQMCGSGHYSMKGLIIVETQEEYDKWLSGQKPQYLSASAAAKEATAPVSTDTLQNKIAAPASKPLAKN
jgi:cytochrome c oxidase subunit 2